MSEDIQGESTPPSRLELPVEKAHRANLNSKDEPRFPGSVIAAGVIWIVLGVSGVLSAAALCLAFPAYIGMSQEFAAIRVFVSLWAPIPLGLFGVLFLLAGFRIVSGAERGTLANGITSVVIGGLLLINVFNACFTMINMAFLYPELLRGSNGGINLMRTVIPTAPQLLIGVLLLTAGRLALGGASQYELWRQARKARGNRA
jgi:hypothetical protein